MNDSSSSNRNFAIIEFYSQILGVHIAAVTLSGLVFAVRGAASLAGLQHVKSAPARYLSYTIDTVLLTAALMLVAVLPEGVFTNHWLTVKLILVVTYIALGVLALRSGQSRRVRGICFVAALLVFAGIIGIARNHHPLGWWVWMGQ